MAKVNAQVVGGQIQQIEANTVREVKQKLNAANYAAAVNGEPASDDQELSDYEYVSLSPAVKGGLA